MNLSEMAILLLAIRIECSDNSIKFHSPYDNHILAKNKIQCSL